MFFKKKGEKTQFRFVNSRCIGRACWAPGNYQHRSPMSGGGSRNTGSPDTPCCMNNAYRGCPEGPDGSRTVECHCGGNIALAATWSIIAACPSMTKRWPPSARPRDGERYDRPTT